MVKRKRYQKDGIKTTKRQKISAAKFWEARKATDRTPLIYFQPQRDSHRD